jgi:hypothetical protein
MVTHNPIDIDEEWSTLRVSSLFEEEKVDDIS